MKDNTFKCDCGLYGKCVNELEVTDNGLSVNTSKLLQCGKVKSQCESIKRLKLPKDWTKCPDSRKPKEKL